jgi:hypothetical protein
MDANNNNMPNYRPCVCGSLTHRNKRSKCCTFHVNTAKSHDETVKADSHLNSKNIIDDNNQIKF